MITTRDLTEKYEITRQTLNNWVRSNKIPAPLERKEHQNAWTMEQAKIIDNVVSEMKTEQLNLFKLDPMRLQIKNRRYLGSKQKLLNFIENVVSENTK